MEVLNQIDLIKEKLFNLIDNNYLEEIVEDLSGEVNYYDKLQIISENYYKNMEFLDDDFKQNQINKIHNKLYYITQDYLNNNKVQNKLNELYEVFEVEIYNRLYNITIKKTWG